jgi:hypothetical protein
MGRKGTSNSERVTSDELADLLREAAHDMGARLPPRLGVAVRPLVEAFFRTTARGGELRVVVNDAFEDAPPEVLRALGEIIVARASGVARPRNVGKVFWDYVETDGLRERMQRNYLARQRSFVAETRGVAWDLDELFDDVNLSLFDGALDRPMLGWTKRPLTYRWGWYSSLVRPNGLLVLNVLLDDVRIPRFVLEGTMYHEMLHMVLDPQVSNGRRIVHTREFRARERVFPRHSELRPEYRKVLGRYARSLPTKRGRRKRRG